MAQESSSLPGQLQAVSLVAQHLVKRVFWLKMLELQQPDKYWRIWLLEDVWTAGNSVPQ